MDNTFQSFAFIDSITLDTTVIVNAVSEPCHVITFTSDFAKIITPQNAGVSSYASIFKVNLTDSDSNGALITSLDRPPRIIRENKTGVTVDSLAAYSIAVEKWTNAYTAASGDIVIFEGATNNIPEQTETAYGTSCAQIASTLIEYEKSFRQIHRDVARLAMPILPSGCEAATLGLNIIPVLDVTREGKITKIIGLDPSTTTLLPDIITAGSLGCESLKTVPVFAYDAKGRVTWASQYNLALPRRFHDLRISYTSTTQVTIAADSSFRDSSNTVDMVYTSNQVIDLLTTGAGGLDTGTVAANTWYYIYSIQKADGTISAVASTVNEAVTGSISLPVDYVYKRQLRAAIRTGGASTILPFLQKGNTFHYRNNAINVISDGSSTSWASVSCIGVVPQIARLATLQTRLFLIIIGGNNAVELYIREDSSSSGYSNVGGAWYYGNLTSVYDHNSLEVALTSSQSFEYRVTDSRGDFYAWVESFTVTEI